MEVESKAGFLRARPLIMVGNGGAQSPGERLVDGGRFVPAVDGLADDADGQAHARLLGKLSDLNLFFYGEELNDRQAKQRPIQFDSGAVRSLRAELAPAEGLLQRAK